MEPPEPQSPKKQHQHHPGNCHTCTFFSHGLRITSAAVGRFAGSSVSSRAASVTPAVAILPCSFACSVVRSGGRRQCPPLALETQSCPLPPTRSTAATATGGRGAVGGPWEVAAQELLGLAGQPVQLRERGRRQGGGLGGGVRVLWRTAGGPERA